MACIGDFKSLLDENIGSDTSSIWLEAISQLINLDDVLKPSEALEQLQLNVTYESNDIVKNRKRRIIFVVCVCELKFQDNELNVNTHTTQV